MSTAPSFSKKTHCSFSGKLSCFNKREKREVSGEGGKNTPSFECNRTVCHGHTINLYHKPCISFPLKVLNYCFMPGYGVVGEVSTTSRACKGAHPHFPHFSSLFESVFHFLSFWSTHSFHILWCIS